MTFFYLRRFIGVVMLASMTTFVFAEDAAPVYDADNLPSQLDNPYENVGSVDSAPRASQEKATRVYSDDAPPQLSLDQRIRKIEQQINNVQNNDANAKMDALQNEVQTLRGQVDELMHKMQQMQNDQRAMYVDVDKRLNEKLQKAETAEPTKMKPAKQLTKSANSTDTPQENSPPAVASNDNGGSGGQPNVAEEQQTYQTAYDLIKAKRYNEAIAALQKMLQKYPSGQFAANAHYWLGELYNLTGKNDEAAREFSAVVSDHPESPRVADAQLKLGLILTSQMKWADAKATFKKIINHYPGTATARLATEQLRQIRQAGH